jgi:hypothetical protein
MNEIFNLPRPLKSRSDIARLLGLQPNARRHEISSAFGRATRCEAWMHIEEEQVKSYENEWWEIRVTNAKPKCILSVRPGGRGAWIDDVTDIPEDVLNFLRARADKNGTLETKRTWKRWSSLKWMTLGGRRLKGKQGEIHALVEIPNVGRPTGEIRSAVLIESLVAPCPDTAGSVRIDLPVAAREIGSAVSRLRNLGNMHSEQLDLA